MRTLTTHVPQFLFALLSVAALGLAGCGSGPGACVGIGSFTGNIYCYNDWDEADCEDHDANEVNGASWRFHEGKACSELGYSASAVRLPSDR